MCAWAQAGGEDGGRRVTPAGCLLGQRLTCAQCSAVACRCLCKQPIPMEQTVVAWSFPALTEGGGPDFWEQISKWSLLQNAPESPMWGEWSPGSTCGSQSPALGPPGMGVWSQDSPTWQLWKEDPLRPLPTSLTPAPSCARLPSLQGLASQGLPLCMGGLQPWAPVLPHPPCIVQGPTDQSFLLFFLQGRAGLPSCQRWPP